MCTDRPILKAFRSVAVAYSDFIVSKAENRLQSLTDRLRDIRAEYVLDLQSLSFPSSCMRRAELEFDLYADAVNLIAERQLDIRPSAVAAEGERVAQKVEEMGSQEVVKG